MMGVAKGGDGNLMTLGIVTGMKGSKLTSQLSLLSGQAGGKIGAMQCIYPRLIPVEGGIRDRGSGKIVAPKVTFGRLLGGWLGPELWAKM